jgi:hypothetical protein
MITNYTLENDFEGGFLVRSFHDETGDETYHETIPATCTITGKTDSDSLAYQVCAELRLGEPINIEHDNGSVYFQVAE